MNFDHLYEFINVEVDMIGVKTNNCHYPPPCMIYVLGNTQNLLKTVKNLCILYNKIENVHAYKAM